MVSFRQGWKIIASSVGTAAGVLTTAGCYHTIDQKTANAVIQRDAKSLATRRGPTFEIELTGYLVNSLEEQKVEFMKSLPELFALRSMDERPAHVAFEDIRGHYELLPLAIDRSAMDPVPAEPDRILRRYEFALSNPLPAYEVRVGLNDRKVASLPLTDWAIKELTLSSLQLSEDCRCGAIVVSKSPNTCYRLISKGFAERPQWFAANLHWDWTLAAMPANTTPSATGVCFARYGPRYNRWEIAVSCK